MQKFIKQIQVMGKPIAMAAFVGTEESLWELSSELWIRLLEKYCLK